MGLSISNSFTAVGSGPVISFKHGQSFTYTISGTFVGTVLLERSTTSGASWEQIASKSAAASDLIVVALKDQGSAQFRFRCSAYTSGTIVAAIDESLLSGTGVGDTLVFKENNFSVGLSGPEDFIGDVIWKLPNADGASGDVIQTDGDKGLSFVTPASGTGDLVGPASSDDFFVPLFDGATGKLLKQSFVIVQTSDENTNVEFRSFDGGQEVGQNVDISAQNANANDGVGGNMSISASAGFEAGDGGDMITNAGASTDGNGGNNNINGGNSTNANAGGINLKPGKGGGGDGAVKFFDNKVDGNQVARMNDDGLTILGSRYVRFTDNTFQVGFRGPATYSADIIWELPVADGGANDFLQTDGAGVLTFAPMNPDISSGTYTPTLTNVTNVAASTAYECQYSRVETVVTVSGKVDIDPTANTTSTELGISLPSASDFSAEEQLGGTAFCPAIAGMGAALCADATNNRAKLKFVCSDDGNNSMFFTFTYRII